MYKNIASDPIRHLRSSELSIEKPTPGQVLLANAADKVDVEIQKLGMGVSFLGQIYDATVPPALRVLPANIPGTVAAPLFELTNGGTGAKYTAAAPVNLPTVAPSRNNKVVVVGAYNAGNALIPGSQASCGFMLMPRVVQVSVGAKCCIWMTFAPAGTINGTHNETVPEYLPVSLRIPDNAIQAVVEAIAGEWRHDPADSTKSDADGRTEKRPLQFPALYRNNPALYAQNFTGPNGEDLAAFPIALNKLIAFLDYGPENINKVIEVGKNTAQTPIPIPYADPRPSSLQLAFHDGYQWSNNSGSITVKVTWS